MSDHQHHTAPPPRRAASLALLLLLGAVGLAPHAQGQEAEETILRTLTTEDYGAFESLGSMSLSPHGSWIAATIGRVDEDGEVRLYRTDADSTIVIPNGANPEFSPDGRWVGVVVRPGQEERRRLEREGEPVRSDLAVVDLEAGEESRREGISSWDFSPDGDFLLLRRYPNGGEGDARGADVLVRELASGVDVNFGSVAEATWHDELPVLAMAVDADGRAGNGVRLYDASSGTLRTMHAEEARFSGLTWADDASDLAVFREVIPEEEPDTVRTVLAWRDVDGGSPAAEVLEAPRGPSGDEVRITTARGLRWSEDGARVFFGTVPVEEEPAADEEPEEEPAADEDEGEGEEEEPGDAPPPARGADEDSIPGLEIWHARDVDPVPQQRLRADQTRRRSDLTAWRPGTEEVAVLGGREGDTSVSLVAGDEAAVFLDGRPWAAERMFGPMFRDVHLVDVETGAGEPVAERVEYFGGVSPEGRYLLFFRDDAWHAHDLEDGETRNLTDPLDGVFVDEQDDRTVAQRRPRGLGGWMAEDRAVLVYDRYDVWRVAPDGSGGERLTSGAEEEVRHRVVRLDFDQDAFEPDEPIHLSLYGEWTKDSGYAALHPDGEVERLVYEPRSIARLTRSEEAETYAFVTQRYDDPPAVHFAAPSFDEARRIGGVNEHVEESFLWGRSELVDYENEWGERLQGALFYPADYEPGRTYPMIVYPYERRSQVLHFWSNPSEQSAYNTTVFTQNGYFVLQPDIVYRPRNPGLSFMEAVIPAVDAAIETGMIDPDRVGLTGHSWGGYQTTFAVTQTDRFAAAVAGAPLTNLVSMYLSFYWNSGGTDARIFEISQGRMEVPWWEDLEVYHANSPVHHIERMETPLLMAFGTEDGAVEFNQGVEFYNAARRTGKDFVLLVYEGENHSLQRRPNQIDYHRRLLEWFDHYLKGSEAPAWITEGVPYVEQEEKLEGGPAAGRVPGGG